MEHTRLSDKSKCHKTCCLAGTNIIISERIGYLAVRDTDLLTTVLGLFLDVQNDEYTITGQHNEKLIFRSLVVK